MPAPVLRWLADDRQLMDEMLLSLCGVMSDGAIAQIVHRAHDESVARAASALGPPPSVSAPMAGTNSSASHQDTATRRVPGTNLRVPNEAAQQDLFEQDDRPGNDSPAPSATTMAPEKPISATMLTLDLPATLTPMVREALAGIFDSVCASGRAVQSQYFDETGWFVPLASLESKGVDPGLALKCLLAEQVIYVDQAGDTRKVHARPIANTEVRGIIIMPQFVVKSDLPG
jgi:hypothetical protein